MPLVPSFTITPLSDGASFIVQDTSTGSDVAITDRKILIYTPANNLLVSAIDFPLSVGSSITISPLTKDYALNVQVQWVNSIGVALYTFSLIWAFVQYALLFLESLTQTQISNPNIANDTNFMGNKYRVFTEVQSALNAINTGESLSAAQSCILRYQNYITNQNLYF
jgi:hypothetical protein